VAAILAWMAEWSHRRADPCSDTQPSVAMVRTASAWVIAWTHDDATDQSYLHVFLAEQPDLNWANPDVDDLPDHLVTMPLLATDRSFGHELLRRIRTLLDSYEHEPMMVGEVYLLRGGESASYLGGIGGGAGELHLSFDFRPLHTPWEADRMQRALAEMEADFAEPGWPTFVLSNHDRPRHRTRYGTEARARAAAVLALTIRGTPFLYAGEELGLEDGVVPPERVVDPDGRDGCRAPIPWTADGDDETGHGWPERPWLPFPANATTHATEAQVGDPVRAPALRRTRRGARQRQRRRSVMADRSGRRRRAAVHRPRSSSVRC